MGCEYPAHPAIRLGQGGSISPTGMGSMQGGGFVLLPSSFWSLAQMKTPSRVPTDHLEEPHQSRPCPVLSTPAALLDQMKCCKLPQTSLQIPHVPGWSSSSHLSKGAGQGQSSTGAVLVLVAGQGLAVLQHSTN